MIAPDAPLFSASRASQKRRGGRDVTATIDSIESKFDIPIADPPGALVGDGIKSIYVNWQGPPVSDDRSCSSSGPVVRSVLTGRNES
jgi:hypothetical protein